MVIAAFKTFGAYMFLGFILSVIMGLIALPFGEFAIGVATLLAYIFTIAIYFMRRIPKWVDRKNNHYIQK